MEEYTAKYMKDGGFVEGGIYTGKFGMKNARQCAKGAVRAGAPEAIIIDKVTGKLAAKFISGEGGAVAEVDIAEEIRKGAELAAFIYDGGDEPKDPFTTPIIETVEDEPDTEDYIYRAELGDPDCPDRMEIFRADSDEDAIKQAYEICAEATDREVVLLELHLLDEDYEFMQNINLDGEIEREAPAETAVEPEQTQSESGFEDFAPNRREVDGETENVEDIITISIPTTGFDPAKIDNLCKMVTAKETLIRAALGLPSDADLPIKIDNNGEQMHFPWFPFTSDGDTIKAYATFIEKLVKTAKEKKRVTAKDRAADDEKGSEKFRMRCLLLQIGFIGDEYKTDRRILLQNLTGNSSYAKSDGYEKMQEKRRKPAADTPLGEENVQ